MLLDLNKLHGQRERVARTLQPSDFEPDPEYRLAAPVELSMDVAKAADAKAGTFRVTGRVTTRLELTCSRCVDSFEIPVDAQFDLRYLPQAENAGEGEREIAEDDLDTTFYRDGVLDVGELVREQLQLVLPMKPLCTEGCRGLCPHCGTNMNRTECGCGQTWEDPRLAPLKNVLTRSKEN